MSSGSFYSRASSPIILRRNSYPIHPGRVSVVRPSTFATNLVSIFHFFTTTFNASSTFLLLLLFFHLSYSGQRFSCNFILLRGGIFYRVSHAVARNLSKSGVADTSTPPTEPDLELKFNLTETELLLVENLQDADSDALILSMTSFCQYEPSSDSRPLLCTLQVLHLIVLPTSLTIGI